ncbi:MAG: hypothetical protein WCV99_13450 [Sterolibacterium sp.]|jgi:hypothetical protein
MDVVDIANDHRDTEEARRIKAHRDEAAKMPAGEPGECERCGEPSGRLVGGACARCRDTWKLP